MPASFFGIVLGLAGLAAHGASQRGFGSCRPSSAKL